MAAPNNLKKLLLEAGIDFNNDTLKVALGNNSTNYTFDPDNHTYVSDVFDGGTTAQEFGNGSGTSYNRQTISNPSTNQDNTDDEGVFTGDNVIITNLDNADIQFIMIYKEVGGDESTPGDDPIITILDDDSAGNVADFPFTTNGSNIEIVWSNEGILSIG